MAISDVVTTTPERTRKGPPCEVCDKLATLPPDQAAALERLLSDRSRRYSEIAAQIACDKDHPFDIAPGTYSRHARGMCFPMRDAGRRLR